MANYTNNMKLIGKKLYLSNKTLHGKKTIHENGTVWIVIDFKEKVLACGMKPAYCVESISTKAWRWIAEEPNEDRDFFWSVMGN
ncbi:MAG: hypothetical protein Q8P81_03240 [Nanoarchaeota archaeon]|nr:hypothetical protein [Nanoarchaeota archaeon]